MAAAMTTTTTTTTADAKDLEKDPLTRTLRKGDLVRVSAM
jgi:hypothetical protein